MSDKAEACPSVRGTPSKSEPFLQSGFLSLSSIKDAIISSETRPPVSKIFATFFPNSLPEATASLSISPVLIFGILQRSLIKSAWVPLPAPGGPNKIIFFILLI